jgi:catechol 2,3-dioxygenase-like lactoylglutathione lyase family enzyme
MSPRDTEGSGISTDGGTDVRSPGVAVNHIGHTVPDIDAAVEWYRDVLGFSVVAEPTEIPAGSGHFADLFGDIVGEYESVELAHMEAADGTGFELFGYDATPSGENARDPPADGNWQAPAGIHHFAVTHPDVEGLVARIEDEDGQAHSQVWQVFPDQDYELAYVRDPWGNFLEVYSHSYVHLFANQD